MPRLSAEASRNREEAALGPDYSEALARGLAVLAAFGAERRPMTLAEAARATGLPRATARRALFTLAHLGFVEAEGRLFRLTPRVLRLASGYLGANGISTLVQPRCERIAVAHGIACSVAMLDGPEVVFVAYGQPARLMPVNTMIGTRLPAHCTALGRVLLAALPAGMAEALIAAHPPAAVTPRTETDPARLGAAIDAARAEGHALVEEEMELGFVSLAVPLRRYDGRVVAALNIGAPAALHTRVALAETFLPLLREEAAELQAQLL
ncbi:IclR family transcriptional regulator domain-containing protein [Pararoseomonas indoligenes]|uniref:Helix-turn-helix domain-containing protein n=1 Tax=Roseomonas indoligenes TaxID=2820811 RepID=A0A940S4S8_9PROT|nr:IclR family transcriptional regulator C-terminal domain-containing protein [Pararoseomonas indoligenes]MBP0492299.1 helix-turn-helix domain-containing protein [Pararoseomonas indoligenes]